MRGGPLSEPGVVDLLQPYIVTQQGIGPKGPLTPEIKELFQAMRGVLTPENNSIVFVLDSQGKAVHAFHAFKGRNPVPIHREEMARYFSCEMKKAATKLELPKEQPAQRKIQLPDIQDSEAPAGVRIFVRSSGFYPYTVPAVEAVPMTAQERKTLAFPTAGKEIPAEQLKRWLVQVYPPGFNEQSGPFQKVSGTLKLEPAGISGETRQAILRGKIKMDWESAEKRSLDGVLEAVLSYRLNVADLISLRGVVEGTYERPDPVQTRSRTIRIQAALESRP